MFQKIRGGAFYLAILFLCTFALFNISNQLGHGRTFLRFITPEEVDDPDYLRFQLQHCQCERRIKRPSINEDVPNSFAEKPNSFAEKPNASDPGISYNQTTCSRDAFVRGAGQKVVAFSFYGDINATRQEKGYFEGIMGNLELMPKIYPGWTMRGPHHGGPLRSCLRERRPGPLPRGPAAGDADGGCQEGLSHELEVLPNVGPAVDLMDLWYVAGMASIDLMSLVSWTRRGVGKEKSVKNTSLALVDVYNCRDLDSRLNERELAAVNEWLEIGEPVHSMRDHPAHFTAMLGAAWGADLRKKNSRSKWIHSWRKILKDRSAWAGRDKKGPDQEVLQR
ncbi:unnamed protein product [Sphagnum tenellum]